MAVNLNFRKTGQGPVLVILHGFLGSSDNWISIAKKLESDFTVMIPDLRNHGQSPHTSTHTYEDMTDDLALLFKINHITKASVLGHSMGGKAAMMFAADYPEKTGNLIVADTAPKTYLNHINLPKHIEQSKLIVSIMEKLDLAAYSTRQGIEQFLALHLEETVLRQFILKNIFRDKDGHFEWKINFPVLRDSVDTILHDVNQQWFSDRKPILNYPVTFIRGLNSESVLDEDIADIKQIYPEARIIDIPDAGHWLHVDQPELFVNAVKESIQH
jgi:esterase